MTSTLQSEELLRFANIYLPKMKKRHFRGAAQATLEYANKVSQHAKNCTTSAHVASNLHVPTIALMTGHGHQRAESDLRATPSGIPLDP
jgi:hypothetical protein